MAKVFIEETTLTAIGDAIRGKEGTTEVVPVTDMATRITDLPSGGGGNEPTDEELTFTGLCAYRFAYSSWDWFIEKYGNRITTKDISASHNMFYQATKLKNIPFVINVTNATSINNTFSGCNQLATSPKIRGTLTWSTYTDLSGLVYMCYYLRDVEDLFTPEMLDGFSTVKVTGAYSCPKTNNFSSGHSLRQLPSWWYKFKLNPESTAYPTYSYGIYYASFSNCFALDEALNIPVWRCTVAQTSNMFNSTFDNCRRLKNITFETNSDGTPIVTEWKSQIIDISKYVGYDYTSTSASSFASNINQRQGYIVNQCYNSGITEDKLIYNDETYQRLKDDPDALALDCGTSTGGGYYSRYNHDSAVATINSLPDTSAYLATAGGTNTIKFQDRSGCYTDGGAINTLTEAEIAVATAKGWTVTLV